MIKVIKEGKKEFEGTCDLCGTVFTYELVDVLTYGDTHPYVKCPVCGSRFYHYIDETRNLNLNKNQVCPPKSYFDENLGGWVNHCTKQQSSTDPYEKIPYWMRPDYKAPDITCSTDNSVKTLINTDTISTS